MTDTNNTIETTEATTKTHGGAREGAGRRVEGTDYVKIRLTPLEHSILKSLGGSKYLREEVLGRLAEMAEDLARDLIEECEGDFQSAVDCCWGDSIESVCEMLPDELSELEQQAVIDNASWLIEHERDQVGGNLYEVHDCNNRDLGYENFSFRAWNDKKAYEILEARQWADDRRALAIVEEAEKKASTPEESKAARELRQSYEDAPCYPMSVRRIAVFKGEQIGEYEVEW